MWNIHIIIIIIKLREKCVGYSHFELTVIVAEGVTVRVKRIDHGFDSRLGVINKYVHSTNEYVCSYGFSVFVISIHAIKCHKKIQV